MAPTQNYTLLCRLTSPWIRLEAGVSRNVLYLLKYLANGVSQVVPWGRPSHIRRDLYLGSKPASEGGTGTAERFWEWCDAQTKSHL